MSTLFDTLVAELERRRELSPRVVNYISGTHDVELDAIGTFLVEKLPGLEDYEVDLILSPVFTPKLNDQAIFAELLGADSVPRDRWPALVQELLARPTRAELVTPDGMSYQIPLPEVALERFVYRLRLEATISSSVLGAIGKVQTTSEHSTLKAIARRAIWESKGREAILARYLVNATTRM